MNSCDSERVKSKSGFGIQDVIEMMARHSTRKSFAQLPHVNESIEEGIIVKEKSPGETSDKEALSLFGDNEVTISRSLDQIEDKTTKLLSEADIDYSTMSAEDIRRDIMVECTFSTVENTESRDRCIFISTQALGKMCDKLALQEEEIAELKHQLSASQQVRATLELELGDKAKAIVKSQAETLLKDQAFKQEVQQLKEKCLLNDRQSKDLQEMIKACESLILSELNVRKNDEHNYTNITAQLQKLNEKHETVKWQLANLESDVQQKIEGFEKMVDEYYISNEDALRQTLVSANDTVSESEEKYESLKAHAKVQIDIFNQEMQVMRDCYDAEIHKLSAAINKIRKQKCIAARFVVKKQKNLVRW